MIPPLSLQRMIGLLIGAPLASALLTALFIVLLMPLMRRYAMARPTARGLHDVPTPQGGGMAIMLACLIAAPAGVLWLNLPLAKAPELFWAMLAGALVLAILGAVDDVTPLSARRRLGVQLAVCAMVVLSTPAGIAYEIGGIAILAWLALASLGLAWFVNLTNFMDGMDGMTVIGLGVPAAFAALANLLAGSLAAGLVALAALGGLIGFAPFNWPKARLFLGDVGSLSLGLIVGSALLRLTDDGHLVPALIAPLYYLADSGITLFQRWRRGENLAQAHRSHFYQRAVVGGMSARGVLARVGALNVALFALAVAALRVDDMRVDLALLALAGVLTGLTLRCLARGA
jgi:UDP-N-acetylmuramyl pentapeptide phosphotransferase/UDP-N-acetylglucosamine-1-phosphate transferase